VWKKVLPLEFPSECSERSALFTQGRDAREVFLIESGLVKLSSTQPDGQETILDLRYPGQWVEHYAALLHAPYAFTATTLTPCEIYRFDIRRFRSHLEGNLEVARLFMREQAIDYLAQADALIRLKTLTAKKRLEWFLVDLIPRYFRSSTPDSGRLHLPLKDYELAELIGVSKQHLSLLKRQMIEVGDVIADQDYPMTTTITRRLWQKGVESRTTSGGGSHDGLYAAR
jgi:CRP/FNR family transcriptional regulator